MVVYALVLQSVLLGFSSAGIAFADPGNDALPAFALCLHNPDGDAPAPNDRPDADGRGHCKYCVLASLQLLATPSPAPPSFAFADTKEPRWLIADWRDRLSVEYPSQRPRGPPLNA
jgi:hypothetical protein